MYGYAVPTLPVALTKERELAQCCEERSCVRALGEKLLGNLTCCAAHCVRDFKGCRTGLVICSGDWL